MHAEARLEILLLCTARSHWVPCYPYMLLATQELAEVLATMHLPATLWVRAQDLNDLTDLERQPWLEDMQMEVYNESKQRCGKAVSGKE
jgi:hypothetical protein